MSQPANTQISISRTVRTRVRRSLFDSIKEHAQRLGVQEVIAPGEEIEVYQTLDSTSTYTPGPNPAWRFGMPVTVNQRTRSTVGQMVTAIAADPSAGTLDFPVQIVGTRQDRFLVNVLAQAGNDIHADARNNSPAPRGLYRIV